MKILTILVISFFFVIASGCSSTHTVNTQSAIYSTSGFQPVHHQTAQFKNIEKKPLLSDHYLMMSLLDRPVTEDQKLMLAFASVQNSAQQNDYPQVPSIFVNTVMIKGAYIQHDRKNYSNNIYQRLIAKDINAISLSGPY